jgi:ATP-dependent DNA helicase DinG
VAESPVRSALARVVGSLPGGGEAREGQIEMAEGVARALAMDRHLVVRAGTGTGKSLAYLVPAVLSGRRVVIATATKALQDQLANKDLPSLLGKVRRPFDYAVLKGRSNYLCVQRLRESELSGAQQTMAESSGVAAGRESERGTEARLIAEWAKTTTTGDQAELPVEPDPRVWSSFSVSADECPGVFRCPSGGECFAEAARARAAEADVIVVNLHLLGAHVASGGAVLPEHDCLIIDEAHEFEEVMSRSLGVSIGAGRLRAVAALGRLAGGSGTRRIPSSGNVDDAVARVIETSEQLEVCLQSRAGLRIRPAPDDELTEIVALTASRLERLEAAIRADGLTADDTRAQRALLAVGRLRNQLAALPGLTEDRVAWVEASSRPTLEIAPIDVAPILSEELFAKMPVVLTSATIPPRLASRLGAETKRTDELDVGSPFDFEEHALLYCAAHLPDRRNAASETAIHEELIALIRAAGGRTLALFTSRAAMDRAVLAVRPVVPFPVLVQGDRSKQALIKAFSEDPATCLFATMGFWQGVDVPGATLSLVVIDRIPFSRPDDPLLNARRELAGDGAFRTVDLPRAASLLAQGAGRLIRTADDRGVVAVLDSRLATASYRWELVRALPPMRRTKLRSDAEEFLAKLAAGAVQ